MCDAAQNCKDIKYLLVSKKKAVDFDDELRTVRRLMII